MVRAGLVAMIYDKTLCCRDGDLNDSAAITLMGTDVERIIVNMRNIHELWSSILEVGIAIWLLQQQVWIACIVPLVISIGNWASNIRDYFLIAKQFPF